MNRVDPYKAIGYFGEWIVHNMRRTDMHLEEVAEYIGVSIQTVSYHIHHKRKPTFRTIKSYAKLFDEDEWYVYELMLRDWL